MKLIFEITLQSAKTGKPLKRKKRYVASSESEARELAEKDGLIPIDVSVIDVWHTVREVAGVSFKNADNTSRQKAIRDCRIGDSVALEHEEGNRHDKNAIRVLDSDRRQLGYLPREVAALLMDWYEPGRSPLYCAVIDDIEKYQGGACPVLRIVAALPSASEEKVLEYVSRLQGVRKPLQAVPRTPLSAAPKAAQPRGKKAAGADGSGCMVLVTLLCAACVVLILWAP